MHFHHFSEEMFYVMEGACTLKTPRGDLTITAGDFIAFPPGEAGAHKIVNTGETPCTVLTVGMTQPHGVSEYPDSNKVFPYVSRRLFRKDDNVGYWDGEAE